MARTAATPLIELNGISLRVGDRLLFRNTHWTIRRREHWAVVGANGSGKTLLANALTGGVPIVGGDFRVPAGAVAHMSFEQQKTIAGDSPSAARWFSLEQAGALSVTELLSFDSVSERNPFEVVAHQSRVASHQFTNRRQRWVKSLGLTALLSQPLSSLSNGEMRKVLLARALLRRPRLLILDDPFTGLDVQFRQHLKEILELLMRRRTIQLLLIATHPDELPRGITHLLQVDRCRIIARCRFSRQNARALFPAPPAPRSRRFPSHRQSAGDGELVRLTDITVKYGTRTIFANLNWVVRRGTSWALLGPNGSGKSTLLSLIIGDNPQAYANDVRVFGQRRGDGESVRTLKRRIGWVSPELHLHFPEEPTCLETVVSVFDDTNGCYWPPTVRERQIARRWLAALGLTGLAEQPFGSVSAGLQRMTLLARALVKSPELLVLDEPCQGLDALHRTRFIQTITNLLRQTTVIYVTHRRDEIPKGIRNVLRLG